MCIQQSTILIHWQRKRFYENPAPRPRDLMKIENFTGDELFTFFSGVRKALHLITFYYDQEWSGCLRILLFCSGDLPYRYLFPFCLKPSGHLAGEVIGKIARLSCFKQYATNHMTQFFIPKMMRLCVNRKRFVNFSWHFDLIRVSLFSWCRRSNIN